MLNAKHIFTWLCRLVAAFLMIQSLFFKFSAAKESVDIFTTLGMEPWGRLGTGIIELIASVLLLIPRTTWLGAALGIATMSGALFFHLTILGIEVSGDGGQLFSYAVITFLSCLILLILDRKKIRSVVTAGLSKF
jgi:uncharacterized membrane protein YphA (DoxX/SURF4 family)